MAINNWSQIVRDKSPNLRVDSDKPRLVEHLLSPHTDVAETITHGTIIDAWMQLHVYLVQTELGLPILASSTQISSLGPYGTRSYGMYPPGTRVVLLKPTTTSGWLILGAISRPVGDYSLNRPDWLLEGSACTFKDDDVHLMGIQSEIGQVMSDHNADRPVDAYPGDMGWMNSLGVGIHSGLTHLMLRASGLSQLDFFYLDHLLRLTAYNYEARISTREENLFDDEGECNEILQVGMYPWEMRGVFNPFEDFSKQNTTEQDSIALGGREEALVEPKEEDQTGIYRYHHYRGFLGDIERVIVSTPAGSSGVNTLSSEHYDIGLSETVRHSNGLLEFRSTKGIVLEKTTFIPVPKQRKLRDDPTGDSAANENYKFSGIYGEGPEHKKAEFEYTGSFQLQALEMLSYLHQSYGLQSFQKHTEDWKVPTREETGQPGRPIDAAYTRSIGRDAFLSLPTPFSINIDHREGNTANYYRSKSMVVLNDDGSVLLEDSWGSQIVMSGGNIKITCQGDLQLLPGRNLVNMAGHDAITRAKGNLELSSSDKNVRIKSEQNLHMLSGNSGNGGLLLESRGTYTGESFSGVGDDVRFGGVVVKSTEGPALIYGQDVYMRSLDGDVILDANSGKGDIQSYAWVDMSLLGNARVDMYGTSPDSRRSPTGFNIFNGSSVMFGQSGTFATNSASFLQIGGQMIIDGPLTCQNVGTSTGGMNGKWGPRYRSELNSAISDTRSFGNTYVNDLVTKPAANARMPYSEGGYGTEAAYTSVGFSFRTDSQYDTEFLLEESRWQQYFRQYGASTDNWEEPGVEAPDGTITGPFPGYNTWTTATGTFVIQDSFNHWDPDTGELPGPQDNNRAGEVSSDKSLEEGYLIPRV